MKKLLTLLILISNPILNPLTTEAKEVRYPTWDFCGNSARSKSQQNNKTIEKTNNAIRWYSTDSSEYNQAVKNLMDTWLKENKRELENSLLKAKFNEFAVFKFDVHQNGKIENFRAVSETTKMKVFNQSLNESLKALPLSVEAVKITASVKTVKGQNRSLRVDMIFTDG